MSSLRLKLLNASKRVKKGCIYSHYKIPSLQYRVLGFAIEESTGQTVVIYQALYNDGIIWSRYLDEFCDDIYDKTTMMNVKRFTLVKKNHE